VVIPGLHPIKSNFQNGTIGGNFKEYANWGDFALEPSQALSATVSYEFRRATRGAETAVIAKKEMAYSR